MLHDFLGAIDLWDFRGPSVKLQFFYSCWTFASALGCFGTGLVSVTVLWFALPAVGSALLLPAVGFALLRAHRRFDVLLAVLLPVLLRCLLFTAGSSAVVLSRILTTCFLAVALSLILPETLGGRLQLPGRLACTSTPLLSIAPFVIVGSR